MKNKKKVMLHPGKNKEIYLLLESYRLSGDSGVANKLATIYLPFITRLTQKYINVLFDDVRDGMSTSTIGFMSALDKWTPEKAGTWLNFVHTYIRFYLMNEAKKRRFKGSKPRMMVIDPHTIEICVEDSYLTEEGEFTDIVIDQFDHLLGFLDPRTQYIIEEVILRGLTFREVGTVMEMSENVVRVWYNKGIEILKNDPTIENLRKERRWQKEKDEQVSQ